MPEQFPICTAYLNCADNEKRALRMTPRTVGSICPKISGTNKDDATAAVYPVKVEGTMQRAKLSQFLSILYLHRAVLWVLSAFAYLLVMPRDILLQHILLNKEILQSKSNSFNCLVFVIFIVLLLLTGYLCFIHLQHQPLLTCLLWQLKICCLHMIYNGKSG